MSLKAAKEALQRKRYTEAIALLQAYCHDHPNPEAPDYIQAQMWMVNAWQRSGRPDKAIPICEHLQGGNDPQIQDWAAKSLQSLQRQLESPPDAIPRNTEVDAVVPSTSNRYRRRNIVLSLGAGYGWAQTLAMIGTVFTMVLLIWVAWMGIITRFVAIITPGWSLMIGGATIVSSVLCYFLAPWIIDITQKRYQRVQWITLTDLEPYTPESVELIQAFCDLRNRDIPRLGWIESDQPVAFCYGVLPNSLRIVISRGLFTVLDDEEVAVIFGHLLGRAVGGSCFVLTFASLPTQLLYMLFVWLERMGFQTKQGKTNFLKRLIARFTKVAAWVTQLLFQGSHYLLYGLLRASTYPSDRFAAEVTGNPNALMRALPKMARGLVSGFPSQRNSRLLTSTRSLGVYDPHTVMAVGIAFEILYARQSDRNLYEVFLWELFNPWATWLQCHSTHPLLAKRLAVLCNYARQLGLTAEYEFPQLIAASQKLQRRRLDRHFRRDIFIEVLPWGGTIGAYFLAEFLNVYLDLFNVWLPWAFVLAALGLGLMFQGALRYPDYRRVRDTDLVSLLIDPYASAIVGEPVQIPGELLSYSAGQPLQYALKLEDQGGLMLVNFLAHPMQWYTDRLGIVKKLEELAGESVIVVGWFRRYALPTIDLANLQVLIGGTKSLRSYHQFWNNSSSSILLMAGLLLLALVTLF